MLSIIKLYNILFFLSVSKFIRYNENSKTTIIAPSIIKYIKMDKSSTFKKKSISINKKKINVVISITKIKLFNKGNTKTSSSKKK